MLAPLALLAIAAQAAPAAPAPVAPAADAASFETELARIDALRADRRWSDVREAVLALVELHTGQPYVRAKLTRLEDDLRQAGFWTAHPPPDPRTLIGGKLERFDRATDQIKLRYDASTRRILREPPKRPKQTGEGSAESQAPEPPPPIFPDFYAVMSGTARDPRVTWEHPLEFQGSYTVELHAGFGWTGKNAFESALGSDKQAVVSVEAGDAVYLAALGGPARSWRAPLAQLLEVADGELRVLDAANSPLFDGKEALELQVIVRDATLQVRVNGRNVLSGKKRKGFGNFAFSGFEHVASVLFEGKSAGQWIDGLADQRVQNARVAFDALWDPRDHLPPWLYARVEAAADETVREAQRALDAALEHAAFAPLLTGAEAEDWERSLAALDALQDPTLEAGARHFARCLLLTALGRLPEALQECTLACEAYPRHVGLRTRRVALVSRVDGRNAARDAAREVVTAFPNEIAAIRGFVQLHVACGQPEIAEAEILRAHAAGADAGELEALARTVARAMRGPQWRSVQRKVTEHYEILSDMDNATCAELGRVLEEANTAARRLLRIEDEKVEVPFRCYFFSGQASYLDYCQDLLGQDKRGTAGLFLPELQQLLVWNHPDRAEFLRTARHEGFHQMLDRLVADVPVWLNEGLAQYFETVRRENGAFVEGTLSTAALEEVRLHVGRNALESLFDLQRAQFYGPTARWNYAASLAVVHWMATAGPKERKRFVTLLTELAKGTDGLVAWQRAIHPLTLEHVRENVLAHVRRL